MIARKTTLTEMALLFMGFCLFIWVLIQVKSIAAPMTFAFVLAMLMIPFCEWLEKRMPRYVASIISVIVILSVLIGVISLISVEIRLILRDLTDIKDKIGQFSQRTHDWIYSTYGIDQSDQLLFIKEKIAEFTDSAATYMGGFLSATAGFLANFLIVLVSTFFFLNYRSFFKNVVLLSSNKHNHQRIEKIINKTRTVIQKYIVGLFTVVGILAVLNTSVLLIIGIKYAIFWGSLAALLNILPFIGPLVGSLFTILFALITRDSLLYPISVALSFWFIQVLESNLISPKVVGGSVSINPFAAILGLVFGAGIWGAAGMILAVPMIAMIKVVCGEFTELKPIAYLLGDPNDSPEKRSAILRLKGMFLKQH